MQKILIFTLVALLSVFFIDRTYSKHNQEVLEQTLISKIEKAQTEDETARINFEELFDFKWDKVYVFSPHTSVEEINEKLGFRWIEAKSTGIEKREDIHLIVFVENNQVAQYLQLPEPYGELLQKEQHLTSGMKRTES